MVENDIVRKLRSQVFNREKWRKCLKILDKVNLKVSSVDLMFWIGIFLTVTFQMGLTHFSEKSCKKCQEYLEILNEDTLWDSKAK